MVITVIFNKLKSLLLLIVNVVNKALCCFRRRRCEDHVVLTHVGVVSNCNEGSDLQDWSEWVTDNNGELDKPKTIQDHIDIYRKQKALAQKKYQESAEADLNFFEDMMPRITAQTKHLIKTSDNENEPSHRLNFEGNDFSALGMKELGEWEENSGWEGETLDWDAQQALREKKRQDRERKALEKQFRRQEKINRSLGARVNL